MGQSEETWCPTNTYSSLNIICVTDSAVQRGTRAILLSFTLNKRALGCDRRRIASLRAEKPKKKSAGKSLKILRLVRNCSVIAFRSLGYTETF